MTRSVLLLALLAVPVAAFAQSPFVEDNSSVLVAGFERSIAAAWGDFNGDDDLDLLVTDVENGSFDNLFRNEGAGAFTLLLLQTDEDPVAVANGVTWADIDDDGDEDLVASSLNAGSLWINQGSTDGTPSFLYATSLLDAFTNQREAAVADFNGDGRLDIAVVRRFGSEDQLLVNNYPAFSTLVMGAPEQRRDGNSACWGDLNNDGFPEIYVVNSSFERNTFYQNNGGVLHPVRSRPVLNDTGRSTSCSWGDVDNDGDLDLALANVTGADLLFVNNQGDGPIPVVTLGDASTTSAASVWGDVDNDGDLDLFLARQNQASALLLNDGSGQFTPVAIGDAADGFAIAATLVDDDEDGDLDLYVTYGGFSFFQQNHLYRNTTDGASNWLEVDLRRATGRNRFGIGAHVYAYATIDGQPQMLLRPMETRSGRAAQNGNRVHFGLGDATFVDSLVVEWPEGIAEDRTVLTNVAVNQILTVAGGSAVVASALAATETPDVFAIEGVAPNPSTQDVVLTVRSGSDAPVRVEVLDVLGRRVQVLEATAAPGESVRLTWDGMDAQGRAVAGGLYLLRVQQGAREDVAKVTLLR